MSQWKHIAIEVDADNIYCGVNCTYLKNPPRNLISCVLFNASLTLDDCYYKRCEDCLLAERNYCITRSEVTK